MQKEFGLLLIECSDYREFLRLHFDPPGGIVVKPKWSYELFARKAGFASKSHIHQVIHGQKNLSVDSAEKVVQALKLSKPWAEYFKALVRGSGSNLDSLRARLKKNLVVSKTDPGLRRLSTQVTQFVPTVYASLGDPDKGASLEEIQQRSRLAEPTLNKALRAMLDIGLITKNESRYKANSLHVDVGGLGETTQFKDDFKFSMERALKRVGQGHGQQAAFYLNTFSVRSKDLPELSHALKELLSEFAVEAEAATGDCIAELVCGFSSNVNES